MGALQRLMEDKLKIKFVKNNKEYSGIPITSNSEDITQRQIHIRLPEEEEWTL